MTTEDIKNILNKSILNKINTSTGINSYKSKYNQDIFKQYKQINPLSIFKSVNEIVYLKDNINNLENLHIFCPTCGKKNKFYGIRQGYANYCCVKCSSRNIISILKSKNTRKKRYGDPNYNNSNKNKQTKLNNIDKNGLNSYQRQSISCKNTKRIRYNDENYCNYQKIVYTRKNNIDKSGLNSYQRSGIKSKQTALNNIDIYGLNGYQRGIIKRRNTCLTLYGQIHHSKTIKYKNRFKNEKYKNKIVKRRYNTMKKNKSFNRRSKQEVRCFELLKTKFPDAEHSYRDNKRYPFNCDIYIPSKDLFIECHFGEFHYKEPFNENNMEHIKRLEKLKERELKVLKNGKNKTKYTSMIKTWTISDPLKLEIFKRNNLNYKIFYNEKQFEEWFNKI